MHSSIPFIFFLFFVAPALSAQALCGPGQPTSGPGGSDYVHEEVVFQDFADKPDGYWLFEPASPKPDSAHVVVFMHGYGAYNPMIYGQWISHLVRHGNIVIFPRYQRNLVFPRPPRFPKNAARGIRDALAELNTGDHVRPIVEPLIIVGHSYGAVTAANLAVNFAELDIPQPRAIMLCAPGTGPLKGARLKDYGALPTDTKMLILAGENDQVVGDEFAQLVFTTAAQTADRNLLVHYAEDRDSIGIRAGHSQCYAIDSTFDTGRRNFTARRALEKACVDAVDYYGYWKLLDALIACTQSGDYCEFAFGNTPEQRSLGLWSDGTPVRELKVFLPEKGEENPAVGGPQPAISSKQ